MIVNFCDIVNKYRDANLDLAHISDSAEYPNLSNTQCDNELNQDNFKLSHIYVFGDSLCDIGNSFDVTKQTLKQPIPATPPYFYGRFSNGLVWVEYLAQLLKVNHDQCTNFAVGGATTGTTNTLDLDNSVGLLGLQQQIDKFKAENYQADYQALYIIWAGANDYLSGGITDYTIPAKNLSNAVESLVNFGAKNIMVLNLPDLGSLPLLRNDIQKSQLLTKITWLHNDTLANNLEALKQSCGERFTMISVHAYSLFHQIFSNPKKFGFTNVKDPALAQYTISQGYNERFFFWDEIHPTTTAHFALAKIAVNELLPVKKLSLVKN
jgi:phospholipase/lecithinase/hemolysin